MIMVSPVIPACGIRNRAALRYVGQLPDPSAMVAAPTDLTCPSLQRLPASLVRTPGTDRIRGCAVKTPAPAAVTWISGFGRVGACHGRGQVHPADGAVLTTTPPCSRPSACLDERGPRSGAPQVDVEDLGEAGVVTLSTATVSRVGSGVDDPGYPALAAQGIESTQRKACSSSTACARTIADVRRNLVRQLLPACGEHHMGAGGCQLLGWRSPMSRRAPAGMAVPVESI